MKKRKITRTATLDLDKVEKILLTGQKMSNVFYNMKQDKDVPEGWRKWAEILRAEWDSLRHY